MEKLAHPIVVDFPLRGEWIAPTTPARRVPSHGTDMLGQRYAYDFFRVDARGGGHFWPGSHLRWWLFGCPTRAAYCWNETVHAPAAGRIIAVHDWVRERRRLYPVLDILRALKNGLTMGGRINEGIGDLAGNYVILEGDSFHAFFAHLIPGSIPVVPGQKVAAGELLGRVGHTGNSTAPHLHFQLMDGPDPRTAAGLPCAFRGLEVFREGRWTPVATHIPGMREAVRPAAPRPTSARRRSPEKRGR